MFKHTELTNKVFQDALDHIVSKRSNAPQTEIVPKVIADKQFLNRMRDMGLPEDYLKLAILNYDDLNEQN